MGRSDRDQVGGVFAVHVDPPARWRMVVLWPFLDQLEILELVTK